MDEIRNLREIALRQEQLLINILKTLNYAIEQGRAGKQAKHAQAAAKQWLDKQDVMQLLNISVRTLYSMRQQGLVQTYPIRGKLFYSADQINELLRSRKEH